MEVMYTPNKVNFFAWRACVNALPTNAKLKAKNICDLKGGNTASCGQRLQICQGCVYQFQLQGTL